MLLGCSWLFLLRTRSTTARQHAGHERTARTPGARDGAGRARMETLCSSSSPRCSALYVVFDGLRPWARDRAPLVARDDRERGSCCGRRLVWDGNEVWLLAAGGTLYFAFRRLTASSFRGSHLPLMMVSGC